MPPPVAAAVAAVVAGEEPAPKKSKIISLKSSKVTLSMLNHMDEHIIHCTCTQQ